MNRLDYGLLLLIILSSALLAEWHPRTPADCAGCRDARAHSRPCCEDLGFEHGVRLVKCSSEVSLSARSAPRRERQMYPA
jgi:hypothetical protein